MQLLLEYAKEVWCLVGKDIRIDAVGRKFDPCLTTGCICTATPLSCGRGRCFWQSWLIKHGVQAPYIAQNAVFVAIGDAEWGNAHKLGSIWCAYASDSRDSRTDDGIRATSLESWRQPCAAGPGRASAQFDLSRPSAGAPNCMACAAGTYEGYGGEW